MQGETIWKFLIGLQGKFLRIRDFCPWSFPNISSTFSPILAINWLISFIFLFPSTLDAIIFLIGSAYFVAGQREYFYSLASFFLHVFFSTSDIIYTKSIPVNLLFASHIIINSKLISCAPHFFLYLFRLLSKIRKKCLFWTGRKTITVQAVTD